VILRGGAVREQAQEIMAGGRYLSGDEPLRVFATGAVKDGMTVEVRWRSGKRSVVTGVRAQTLCEVDEAGATIPPAELRMKPKAWFEEVALATPVRHVDEGFEDFERQPLLARRLSQGGPGVGWIDVDGDGRLELVVGSGKGGKLTVLKPGPDGKWTPLGDTPTAERDQTGLAALPGAGGKTSVMFGTSNYEDGSNLAGGASRWTLGGEAEAVAQGPWAASGPVAVTDVDGDGELEAFVGGRVNGGRYPESSGSRLYRRQGGAWILDAANSEVLKATGMVNGAVWSDLTGDGWPELLVACEWGGLQVYRNERGRLAPWKTGLEAETGWWNGVTTGDLDGDGRLDVVATNWGKNTKYRADREHPRRLYHGDLAGLGQMDLVEAYWAEGKWVPERDLTTLGKVLPWVREQYATHQAYAETGVAELLGERVKTVGLREAVRLETSVWLNRGDRFEAVPLPEAAQWSVGFGVNVGDADGDGLEDVFVAQNFFAVNAQTSRSDAGRGLWLHGDGKGGLRAVDGEESGVKVYGEQRGSALGDFDGDGRVDLAVGQNGAEVKVYRNVGGRRGLRVRLEGGAGNPGGVGGVLRLEYADGSLGAAREVHGGSGYWSQDSWEQVLGKRSEVKAVRVRWPGGAETRQEVPPNQWLVKVGRTRE
jgi:hypothetical protein